MSVTIGSIYSRLGSYYSMELAAGDAGAKRSVNWVHIVEDSRVSNFLRGGELVFTTGIMNNTASWMCELVRHVDMAGASGMVVNLGPYIPRIPEEVVEYCNRRDFPLFTIPWETRMVDMTREICSLISRSLNDEISISAALKGLVLGTADEASALRTLEAGGLKVDMCARLMCIGNREGSELTSDLRTEVEEAVKSLEERYCAFEYDRYLMVLLGEWDRDRLVSLCDAIFKGDSVPYIGISGVQPGLKNQHINLRRAVYACRAGEKQDKSLVFYDELGIYKLLLEVGDRQVLEDYYRDSLGSLEAYDREHGSDYMGFLKTYLECNGVTQVVSEREYIHRNTVVNHLKKIEKITGLNLMELDAKVRCSIALNIKNILN